VTEAEWLIVKDLYIFSVGETHDKKTEYAAYKEENKANLRASIGCRKS